MSNKLIAFIAVPFFFVGTTYAGSNSDQSSGQIEINGNYCLLGKNGNILIDKPTGKPICSQASFQPMIDLAKGGGEGN